MRLQERYGLVLGLLTTAFVLDALDERALVRLIIASVFAVLVLAAILTPHTPRWLRWTGIVGLALSFVLVVAAEIADDGTTLDGLAAIAAAVALTAALVSVAAQLATHQRVEGATIMGALLVYLLIGFVAAFVYEAVDVLSDSDFFAQGAVEDSYLYFSFVTLTTLGFGDLSPGTDLAERLVVVEALAGQIFLVVLVSRLVTLFGKPLRPRSPD